MAAGVGVDMAVVVASRSSNRGRSVPEGLCAGSHEATSVSLLDFDVKIAIKEFEYDELSQ